MRIRSRGLGRRELLLDPREFTVSRHGDGVVLEGVTHAPITWETTICVGTDDVGRLLRLALKPAMLRLGVRWVLRRKDAPFELPSPERAPRRAVGTRAAAVAAKDGPAARVPGPR